MTSQVLVDSVVAINILVSLYLALLLSLWMRRAKLGRSLLLSAYLILAAFFPTMVVISVSHASWAQVAWVTGLLDRLELLLTVVAGPLVFVLACNRLSAAYLALTSLASVFGALGLWYTGNAIFIVFLPAAFTSAAIMFCLALKWGRGASLSMHLLGTASAIHLAQLLRYLGRDLNWLREVVPVTATLIGLGYLAWFLQRHYRSGSTRDRLEISPQVFSELDNYVRNTQPFRNPELSVASLANEINLPTYLVSQAINQYAGRFNDYINGYRVNAFIREYSPQSKIEPLAYDAGFKSRSAFYRAFKACTGKSPLEYFSRPCPDL